MVSRNSWFRKVSKMWWFWEHQSAKTLKMYVHGSNLVACVVINSSSGIEHALELSNFCIGRAFLTFTNSLPEKKSGNNMIKSNIKTLSFLLKQCQGHKQLTPSLQVLTYKTQTVNTRLTFHDCWPRFLAQEMI